MDLIVDVITRSSTLSYMNLQPGSGCELWMCKEHLSLGCTLLMTSSSSFSSSWLLDWVTWFWVLKVNCDTNLFIRCPNGVIQLLIIFEFFEDEGFSFVVGVDDPLDVSENGLSCKRLGDSKMSSLLLSCSSFRSLCRTTEVQYAQLRSFDATAGISWCRLSWHEWN